MTNIPPERRISGRLTNWERDINHLAHYAQQTGSKRLERRIVRLRDEIQKALEAARALDGRGIELTEEARAILRIEVQK